MSQLNEDTTPLHDMNPLGRFSDRATDYAKYRPSYPAATIDTILEGFESPPQLAIADVGAGTGISSRLLAERGIQVFAIEPNAPMREAATPHPRVEFREGTAETTTLGDTSVDLVTCFHAFHWFNAEPTLHEFRRILKARGRLAIAWNDWDKADEFTETYSRLVRIASNNHPAESRRIAIEPLFESPLFTGVRHHAFTHSQALDWDGLVGRAKSISYVPRQGVAHEQLLASLRELYDRHRCDRDLVRLVYRTELYLAEPLG